MPYWYTGGYDYQGGLMKAASARRGLEALARGVEGGKEAVMRYREGGMQGVFDPEYAAKQKEAREQMPELRAELGVPAPAPKPAEPKDDSWWGNLMGGVGSVLGKKDQVDLAEYARLKGLQGRREAETRRARATSPLWPYMKDPTRAMPESWGFKPGDITIEHPRGEPKPEKTPSPSEGYTGIYKLAWDAANDKAQKQGLPGPTGDMIKEELRGLQTDAARIKAENKPPGAERDPKLWLVQYRQAKAMIEAEYKAKGIPHVATPDEIWARVGKWNPKAQTSGSPELDALLHPKGKTPSPVADDTGDDDSDPGADDEDQDPDANVPSPNPILDRPAAQPDARVNPAEGGKHAKPTERRVAPAGSEDVDPDLLATPPAAQLTPHPPKPRPHGAAPPPSPDDEDPDLYR